MNYFAHGLNYLDKPYFLAGTAVPDWLSIVDRRVRTRSRSAAQYLNDPDPIVVAVAGGVVRHHHDDGWFHRTAPFAELSWKFTAGIRELMPDDDGLRPSFLGHILVEILLDSVLVDMYSDRLDGYYQALETVDPAVVSAAVGRMASGPVDFLPGTIQMFRTERFLYDYGDDVKLLGRLNRVMRRVKLAELSPSLLGFFPGARHEVREQWKELMAGALPQKLGDNHEIRNEPPPLDGHPGRRNSAGPGTDQGNRI